MSKFNNSTISLVLTLAIKAVKVWLSSKELELNSLVEEWVKHYFTGKGIDKGLPSDAIEETKEAVKVSLQKLWRNPSWKIHTANVGSGDGMQFWFCSLGGVIGYFTYNLIPEENGVRVKCWDLWDFNGGIHYSLMVQLPESVKQLVKRFALLLGIKLLEEDGFLEVQESELAKLNQGRQFYTRWEFFLTWDELKGIGMKHPMLHKWEHGGLPLEWFIKNTP